MAMRGLGFVSILVLSLFRLIPTSAVTFTVNSTADSSDASPGDGVCDAGGGVCTLRAAIEEANALAGADTIQFAVGSGPQTITINTPLPTVNETVTIDGTTQPGYSGTPLIALDGNNASLVGMRLGGGASTIRALQIDRFGNGGILLVSDGNIVEQCIVGTDVSGTQNLGNGSNGILVQASNNLVRNNVIAFNAYTGVGVYETPNSSFPLFTALTPDQTHTTQTIDYVDDCGSFHHVNDNSPILDNAGHAFNENFGARFTATMSIPMAGSYHFAFPNLDDLGRLVIDSTEYVNGNGGSGPQFADVVLSPGDHAIEVDYWEGGGAATIHFTASGPGTPTFGAGWFAELFQGRIPSEGNKISRNSIYDNSNQGIALSCCCVDINDAGDLDVGPNTFLNYPVFTNRTINPNNSITLDGTAPPNALVEVFASTNDNNGHGEGKVFLGDVTANGGGDFNITVTLPPGYYSVTATATDASNNTSEFSQNFFVLPNPITVTNTNEFGPGSLRDAIDIANTDGVESAIAFDPLLSGSAIPLTGSLPALNENGTTINGDINGDCKPDIEVRGNGTFNGITIFGAFCTIRGLALNRFNSEAITLPSGSNNNTVVCNFIGTDLTGTISYNTGAHGIVVRDGASNNIVRNNVIAAFGQDSLNLTNTPNNVVQGNTIGLSATGTVPMPSPVGLQITSSNNTTADGNRILGTNGAVDVQSSTATSITGSTIGWPASSIPLGYGIRLFNTSGSFINANHIENNGGSGIRIEGAGSDSNAVRNNAISGNGALGIDLDGDGVTPNDNTADADNGANDDLNFPVITHATANGANTAIEGFLDTAPGSYDIDFYVSSQRDPSGYGEGATWLQSGTIVPGGFTFNLPAVPVGSYITATVTGGGNTSEFSLAIAVAGPPAGAPQMGATELVAYPVLPNAIALRWRDPQVNETGFRIERIQNPNWVTVTNVGPDTTTFTDTSVQPGETRMYRVVAFTPSGDAPPSNIGQATAYSTNTLPVCRERASAAHEYAGSPSVAWNGTNWAMAYASQMSGRESDIFFRLLNADGTPNGPPIQITNDDVPSTNPTLVWNGTNYGLLWFDHLRGANGQPVSQLTFALLGPSGAKMRGDIRVTSANAAGPMNPDGDMPLIWDGSGWGIFVTESTTSPSSIVFYRLDDDGDVVVNGSTIVQSPNIEANLSATWNGTEYGVAWVQENGPNSGFMRFVKVQTNGISGPTHPAGGIGGAAGVFHQLAGPRGTSVVWNGSGWAVAGAGASNGMNAVWLSLLDANGNLIGAPVRMSGPGGPLGTDINATPKLFNKSGGGYIVFTTTTLYPSFTYEVGRFEADASGQFVGPLTLVTPDDGANSQMPRLAFDGNTSYLAAWNEPNEIDDAVVSGSGVVGTINGVTGGHGPDYASSFPTLIEAATGFVAFWDESVGNASQLHARFYRPNGTTLDRRPVNGANPVRKPSAITIGGEIALAWGDRTTQGVHFDRIDMNGNSVLGGGVRISDANVDRGVAMAFNGEEFGVVYVHPTFSLNFQRMGYNTPIGPPTIVGDANGGDADADPQIQWTGSGWAIVWGRDRDLWYAKVDPAGALVVPPMRLTDMNADPTDFQLLWNGQTLGLVTSENGNIDFTTVNANGFKNFTPVLVVNTMNADRFPALYFDGTNFRIVYPDVATGMREVQVTPTGSVLPGSRFLGNHGEGRVAVAFNGAATAMAWEHRGDILFQTTGCLADTSAPPCASVNASFTNGGVQFNWSQPPDPQSLILGSSLYRDGRLLTEISANTFSYFDGGVTPAATYNYQLRALNGAYLEATGCATQTITAGIVVSPPSLPNAKQSSAYNQTISASQGTAPYTFAVTNGTLPTGLSLATNGALSGTPTVVGQQQFTITATDNVATTGARTYLLRVCPATSLVPTVLPDPVLNAPYHQLLTIRGTGSPQTYSVTAGALPAGLALAADGNITGTPTAAGSFSFTITATESNSCATPQQFSFTVITGMAPRDVAALAQSSSSILVRWTRPQHGETGFRVERSLDGGATWGSINIVGPDVTSHLDSGLGAATNYTYRVVAFDGFTSATSGIAAAMTFPLGPTKICAQAVGPFHPRAQAISVAHDGTKWAGVWMDRSGGALEDIRFQFFDNTTGAPLGSSLLVAQNDNFSRFPLIRWNGTRFGVLYFDNLRLPNGDSASTTSFALLDPAGNVLRSGVRLNNANVGFLNGNADIPFLWDGTGWGVITVETTGNTPADLYYRRLLPNGDNANVAVRLTNTPNDFEGDVAAAWNGSEYGVAWIESRDTSYKLRFARMQTNGTFVGSTQLIEQNGPGETLAVPTVTWNGSEWGLAWNVLNGNEAFVRFKRLNPDGTSLSATVRLSDDTIIDPMDDEIPIVMPKPGGGYLVFTASLVSSSSTQYDVARLTADASGNRTGARMFLTPNDGTGTNFIRVATGGSRFLVGHDAISSAQFEVATLVVDAAGNPTSGPATITSGHTAANSSGLTMVAMGANFGALWAEGSGAGMQLYGKFFDGGGNLSSTRFPMFPSTAISNRFAAAAGVGGFGLAWRDGSNLRFGRFDVNGNSQIADVVVSGGNAPGLAWNGEQFGLAFFEGSELRFQRMNTNGTTSGPKIFVGTGNSGPTSPLVRWVDRGWAIVWRSGSSLFFALLDRNGAYVVAPGQFTFSGFAANNPQIAWSGDVLGVVWRENRQTNLTGDDIWFTALGLDGTKQFTEKAIVSTLFSDSGPAIYWDHDRFRVVFNNGSGGTKEIAVMPDGTIVPGERLINNRPFAMSVAFNGITNGMLFNGLFDTTIESSSCLDDTTAPSCPNSSVSFDGTKVHVSWSAVSDPESGLLNYNLYRDGTLLAELQPNTLAYDDRGFISGFSHVYEVRALNRAFKESSGCTPRTITAGVTVNPSTLPNSTVNGNYNATVTGSGGTAPYTFAVTAGALPPGVTLASGGAITGVPTTGGLFNVTITATDALAQTGARAYTIRICFGSFAPYPTVLTDGIVSVPYSQTIVLADPVGTATMSVTTGALPAGLTLDPTGWLHGTPATAGTFNFTITANDTATCSASRAYTLVVQVAGAARALSAYATGTSSIRLRWTDPQRNETAFRIERSLDLGATWTAINIVGPDATTYNDTSLTAATAYAYRVIATTPSGDASPSNSGTATTWPAAAAKTCIQQISPYHAFARAPSVVRAGSQWAMAYQDRKNNENDEIWFSFLDANGAMTGTPKRVTNNDSVSIRPRLVWNGSKFGVAWFESLRGPNGELVSPYRFALLDASGNVIRGDVRIPMPEVSGLVNIDLQLMWDGSAWAFFESHMTNDGLSDIFFYRFDEDGDLLAGPVRLTTHTDFDYLAVVAWNGSEYGVTWRRDIDDQAKVLFQRFSIAGAPLGSEVVVDSGLADFFGGAGGVTARTGGWAVAYITTESGQDSAVYMRLLDANGALTGARTRVSEDSTPSVVSRDNTIQDLVALPSGFAVFTNSKGNNEVGMLHADANGNRSAARTFLSTNDTFASAAAHAAFDGTNFLAAFNEGRLTTLELASVIVDTAGTTISGPTDLTSGHSPGNSSGVVTANSQQLVAVGAGFAALWNEPVTNDMRLSAKIFDGSGNLSAARFPLSTRSISGRAAAVGVGSTFAVAFRDTANNIVFCRYDASGNPLIAEANAVTAAGGANVTLLGFDGATYAIVFNQGGRINFQRVSPSGTPLGARSILAPVLSANLMQMAWTGAGWAIVFVTAGDVHYVLLDPSGAVLAGPVRVSFTPTRATLGIVAAWSGDALGVAWTSFGNPDPPGSIVQFTVLGADGIKQFNEQTVSEGRFGTSLQGLNWTGDRFRLDYLPGEIGTLREVDFSSAGATLGSPRTLSSRGATSSVVWNGATSGVLFATLGELYFETTACLADATAPPCPSVTATHNASNVTLDWPAVTDPESSIWRYIVYRDGLLVGETSLNTFIDASVRSGETPAYRVTAVNGAFKESQSCTTFTLLESPSNLAATGVSATQAHVTWTAVAGAAQYLVERTSDGVSYAQVGTASSTSFDDMTTQIDHAYLYRVRAATPQQTTAPSNVDLATATPFTDDPLVAGTTQMKWAHMSELRRAVDAVRALAQLPAATYTNPGGAGTTIGNADMQEVRAALAAARGVLGLPAATYTNTIMTGGWMKAIDFQEVRMATR